MCICTLYAMYPNVTCVFPVCLSIFIHKIYLGYETNWCEGRGVIWNNYFWLHKCIFFKKNSLKISAKCAQQSMTLTYQKLLCPKPLSWSLQGSHDSPLPLYQQTFRKIHYTNWSNYPHLKMSLYASVCNNTVMMFPLFIELIVSFWIKNNTGKIYVTQGKLRKTQGISFWLECGHPEWPITSHSSECNNEWFLRKYGCVWL